MVEEKILLLQLILEDIRGNWGWDLDDRVAEALELAVDLDLASHIESIEEFKDLCDKGDVDGRYFRCHYTDGGYEKMEELHGLEPTYKDKSDWFKAQVTILTYPECRFKDWED